MFSSDEHGKSFKTLEPGYTLAHYQLAHRYMYSSQLNLHILQKFQNLSATYPYGCEGFPAGLTSKSNHFTTGCFTKTFETSL